MPAPDSTRQRILAATAEVLGRNGMIKLSLSHVAPQAGVSRPTLYRWFASKKNLLDAFVVWERQQRVSAVIQLWPCRCRNRRSHALPSFEPNN